MRVVRAGPARLRRHGHREALRRSAEAFCIVRGYPCYNVNRYHGIVGSQPVGSKVKVKYRRLEDGAWKEHEGETVLGDPAKALEGEHAYRAVLYGFGPAYEQAGDGIRINSVAEKGPAEAAGMRGGSGRARRGGRRANRGIRRLRQVADGQQAQGRRRDEAESIPVLSPQSSVFSPQYSVLGPQSGSEGSETED